MTKHIEKTRVGSWENVCSVSNVIMLQEMQENIGVIQSGFQIMGMSRYNYDKFNFIL